MIELHVLKRSDDGTQLLLAAHPEAESAGYAITLDERLRDFVAPEAGKKTDTEARPEGPDEVAPEPEPEPEPEPTFELPVGPLDVGDPAEALDTAHGLRLVRLVAAETADEAAEGEEATSDAEVGEASPQEKAVSGERAPRSVPLDAVSDLGLHDSVLANLHKWNVRIPTEVLDDGWWVTKLGDQAWQISFRFLSRGRIHEAEWVLDTEEAELVPENDLAAMLGWWKPQRQRRARRRRGGRGRRRGSGRRRASSAS